MDKYVVRIHPTGRPHDVVSKVATAQSLIEAVESVLILHEGEPFYVRKLEEDEDANQAH